MTNDEGAAPVRFCVETADGWRHLIDADTATDAGLDVDRAWCIQHDESAPLVEVPAPALAATRTADGGVIVSPVGPPLAPWCETCGNEVSPEGKCACWCFVADALQRYLGMDFDGAALMASQMWDATEPADRAYVWAARYADDHDVETYPDERRFAPAEVRAQDHLDHPHDEPCPVCGRRQWGGPDPYVTCQGCGHVLTDEEERAR